MRPEDIKKYGLGPAQMQMIINDVRFIANDNYTVNSFELSFVVILGSRCNAFWNSYFHFEILFGRFFYPVENRSVSSGRSVSQ